MPTATATKAKAPVKNSVGRLKTISLGRRDVRVLKLKDCDVLPELNPRTTVTRERIDALKAQLRAAAGDDPKSNGQREPARGHILPSGKFGLTTGKTRHIALSELAQEEKRFGFIIVMPEPKGYTEAQRDLDHITSNDGAPLLMTEQAVVYERMKTRDGLKVAQIAQATGKTEQHIYDCLTLLGMPEAVREAVNKQQIAASTVVQIAKKVEPGLVASTVKTAIAQATLAGKSKATSKHVPKSAGGGKSRKASRHSAPPPAAVDPAKAAAVEEFKTDHLSRLMDPIQATVPSKCIADRRQAVEFSIEYLLGNKSITQFISFLQGDEELI